MHIIHNHVCALSLGYDNVVQIEVMPLQTVFHGKGGNVQFTISSTHSSCQKKGSTPTLWREIGNENFERRLVKLD